MTDNNINLYLTIDMWRFRAIYFLIPILFVVPLMIADETASPAIDENTPPEVLLPLAENGDAVAQYFLALAYAYGKGVKQDDAQTFQWLSQSAERGLAAAQLDLGILFQSGIGVPQDMSAAVKWYRNAADQGLAVAQYNLGVLYEHGNGVGQDAKEAVRWYRVAAEQGLAVAQNNLGFCYERGFGVDHDAAAAIRWYREAAEQGLDIAQNALGFYYERDFAGEKDAEAAAWYRKAAEQGHAAAQFNLARAYKSGRGVPQDGREADQWLRKSAAQGFPAAQEVLDSMKPLTKGDRARKVGEGLGQMTITGYLCSVIIAAFFCTIRRWLTGKHTPFWRATGFCFMFYFALCTVCVGLLTFLILPAMNTNPNPEPVWFQVFTVGTTLLYGIGLGTCVLKFLDVDWKTLRFGRKMMTVLAFIASSVAVMVVTVIVLGILFATLPG